MKRAALSCLLLSVQTIQAADRFDGLDDYIRAAMQRWQVPGVAIAVVKDGEVVVARGYGVRHLGGDAPITPETVFSIASCTKTFTAASIAMLVDDGKLRWDDPVRKHLPEFQVADPYVTEHVTIRDLLCHRTGLVRGDLIGMRGGFTHAEMLEQVRFLSQAAPFRSKVTYSSMMFTVLGEIVAKNSGMSWERFVRERIFEPLGMEATTTDRAAVAADRLATRHRLYDGELAPVRTPLADKMAAAGGIHSTVTDLATWLSLQLGEGSGRRLISMATIREMHSLQQSIPVKWRPDSDVYDPRFVGTGLGWYVRDYRGRKVVQHGGAWGAEMAIVPEENLGVVVLSNRDFNGLVWMLIFDVMDAYLVGPEKAWEQGKKWDRWLAIGGPGTADRVLVQERAQLMQQRKVGTKPTLPLEAYGGTYQSVLYSDLSITVVDGRLRVRFGDYSATLEPWEQNSFYGRAVIEPFFDWLVKFEIDERHSIKGLEIIHVGWKEPDEQFLFTRRAE